MQTEGGRNEKRQVGAQWSSSSVTVWMNCVCVLTPVPPVSFTGPQDTAYGFLKHSELWACCDGFLSCFSEVIRTACPQATSIPKTNRKEPTANSAL